MPASKVIGKPVQITWSREAEMATGYLLPPFNKLSVALSADGMQQHSKLRFQVIAQKNLLMHWDIIFPPGFRR